MKLITCILSLMLSQGVVGPHVGIISHPVGGGGGGPVAFDAVGPSGGGGAYHTATTPGGSPGSYTLTWTHPGGATLTNGVVIVGCLVTSSNKQDEDYSFTSPTYGGAALTAISGTSVDIGTNYGKTQMFGKIAPATGSQTVSITLSWVSDSSEVYEIECGSDTFTGANQTTAWQNANTASGSGTTASVAVTSATNHMVIDIVGVGSPISAHAKTLRWNYNTGTTASSAQSTAAGASSVTMSYTLPSDLWGIAGLDITY